MRRLVAIVVSVATLVSAFSEVRDGIPFHTKSPTSTGPVGPQLPFTPSRDKFARMLVERRFRVVTKLDAIDPAVRKLWFQRYPRKDIALLGEPFAGASDTEVDKAFRFILAGQAADTWFILFETAGLLHHYTLVFFQRAGGGYRVVEAAYGNLSRDTFEACVAAVRKGQFVKTDDLSRY
jgi:hypothetical protein